MQPIFTFRWLRRLVRKNMRPVAVDKADTYRRTLSKIYVFFAFNATGLIIYQSWKKDLDLYGNEVKGLPNAEKFKHFSKGADMEIIEVKGLKVTDQYLIKSNSSSEK